MSDIDVTKNHIVAVKYNNYIKIHNNITVTFFKNGHLIGASIILVQIKDNLGESINLLFTGDYKPTNTFFQVRQLPFWVYALPNLTIITESTYGTSNSSETESVWENDIIEACAQNKVIVNTAFGQGRFQELMYHIKKLQDEGKIPQDYPIRLDGTTGIDYTFRYLTNANLIGIPEEKRNIFPYNLQFVDNNSRNSVMERDSRQIIISTSGMGSHGPAAIYIPHYLSNPNAMIYFTGYTSPCTTGRHVFEAEYGEDITFKCGQTVKKNATVLQTTEFSSHAKADELIDFINQFSPRSVLINHGEPSVKVEFEKMLKKDTGIKKTGILGMGYVYRITSYGIDKAVET